MTQNSNAGHIFVDFKEREYIYMSMCREKVEAFWAAHDKNGDGVLSADEVRGNLKSSGQCKMSSDAVDVSLDFKIIIKI